MDDVAGLGLGDLVTGRRRTAIIVVAVLLGLLYALLFFGFIGLVVGWFEGGDRLIHRVHDIGNGIAFGILGAVPFFAVAWRPERRVAAVQLLAVVGVAGIAAGLLATEALFAAFGLGQAAFAALLAVIAGRPYRTMVMQWDRRRVSPWLLGLAVLAAIPLGAYALTMARLQRLGPPTDPHVEMGHWVTMAFAAIGITGAGLLASLRPPGWRVPAWCAGAGAIILGLASVVFPGYPASVGRTWGSVAIAGGVMFVAAAEWVAPRGARPVA